MVKKGLGGKMTTLSDRGDEEDDEDGGSCADHERAEASSHVERRTSLRSARGTSNQPVGLLPRVSVVATSKPETDRSCAPAGRSVFVRLATASKQLTWTPLRSARRFHFEPRSPSFRPLPNGLPFPASLHQHVVPHGRVPDADVLQWDAAAAVVVPADGHPSHLPKRHSRAASPRRHPSPADTGCMVPSAAGGLGLRRWTLVVRSTSAVRRSRRNERSSRDGCDAACVCGRGEWRGSAADCETGGVL